MKNKKAQDLPARSIGPLTALKFELAMAKVREADAVKQMHMQTAATLLAQHGVSFADVQAGKIVIEAETGNLYTPEEAKAKQLAEIQSAMKPEEKKDESATPAPIPLPRVQNGNGKRT
jgi:hypothetical protein